MYSCRYISHGADEKAIGNCAFLLLCWLICSNTQTRQ